MKKLFKTLIALTLCSILSFGLTVHAADNDLEIEIQKSEKEIYGNNLEETININGINYTYNYYYDKDGNRTIRTTNNSTKHVDIIKYDKETSEILLNDEVIVSSNNISDSTTLEKNINKTSRANRWKYIGTKKKNFSWKKNELVSNVAASLAMAIPGVTVKQVIAQMGLTLLSQLAKTSTKGTVTTKTYQLKAGKLTNNKYVATLVANGKKRGTYTFYVNS